MTATDRPRRSMLYIPGDKPRALEKARSLPADSLVLDLEDSVAPENKAAARETIAAAVRAGYGKREVLLRVGGPDMAEDFALAESLGLDGVVVPKVDSVETVRAVTARTRLPVWCMIETPLGVLRSAEIAAASDRLAGFIVGTNDLIKDLRGKHVPSRTPLLTSLSLILLAARAHGLAAIDGVHLDLDDLAGFEESCRQGVELGFDGKSLVHPNSIEPANRIFAPGAAELANARRMVEGWEAARAQGLGVVRIDGKMVEELHVADARRLIALSEAIETA